jgi:hypothetical protein
MGADALHLNLPAITTRPAIVDQQFYQPRARLDLQARRLVEFGTAFVRVRGAATVALADLQRFAEELEEVATATAAVGPAICSLDRPVDVTKEHGGAIWSDHNLTAAFHFAGNDYDVAEAEEANLRASRTYGW